MAKKTNSKKSKKMIRELPPESLWLKSGRFYIYAVDGTYQIWHNPKPRRIAELPTKQIGVAFLRPNMKGPKKWGAVLTHGACPRIIGYFENDSALGYWLEDKFSKIKT
jgi:hypothetical protein